MSNNNILSKVEQVALHILSAQITCKALWALPQEIEATEINKAYTLAYQFLDTSKHFQRQYE